MREINREREIRIDRQTDWQTEREREKAKETETHEDRERKKSASLSSQICSHTAYYRKNAPVDAPHPGQLLISKPSETL